MGEGREVEWEGRGGESGSAGGKGRREGMRLGRR